MRLFWRPFPASCPLLARGADEAAGMVGLAKGRHHLPLDEVLAAEAARPVQALVVLSADVFALTHEEASLGQLTSTDWDKRGNGERGQPGEGEGGAGRRTGGGKKKGNIRNREVRMYFFFFTNLFCAYLNAAAGMLANLTLLLPLLSVLPEHNGVRPCKLHYHIFLFRMHARSKWGEPERKNKLVSPIMLHR